jgi:hypothetical protein
LPASAEQVIVRDAMGRSVPISETPDGERKKIYMTTVSQGLFVVTYQWNGVLHHDRIMVRYP